MLQYKLFDLVHADCDRRLLVLFFPPAAPVDAEVRLRRAVRALVHGPRLRLGERLQHATQRGDVVHEAQLGLDLREHRAQERVCGRVGEQREEGRVEEGLQERENLCSTRCVRT